MIGVRQKCTYWRVQPYQPGIWHNARRQAVHPTDRTGMLLLLGMAVRRATVTLRRGCCADLHIDFNFADCFPRCCNQ